MSRFFNTLSETVPLAVMVLMLTAGFFVGIADLPERSLCAFQTLFHIDCPGCGLTRGFLLIPQGQWRLALQYNAAALPLYFFFAYVFLKMSWERVRKRDFPWVLPDKAFLGWFVGILALLLLQWGFKMYTLLAPRWV